MFAIMIFLQATIFKVKYFLTSFTHLYSFKFCKTVTFYRYFILPQTSFHLTRAAHSLRGRSFPIIRCTQNHSFHPSKHYTRLCI